MAKLNLAKQCSHNLTNILLGFLNHPKKSKAPVWFFQVSADDDLSAGKQPNWLEQQAWILAALDAKFAQQEQVIRDLLDTQNASAFEGVMPKNRGKIHGYIWKIRWDYIYFCHWRYGVSNHIYQILTLDPRPSTWHSENFHFFQPEQQ